MRKGYIFASVQPKHAQPHYSSYIAPYIWDVLIWGVQLKNLDVVTQMLN